MPDRVGVGAGERSEDELFDLIQGSNRVVVRTEFLGSEHEVTLRADDETYYCDTPTRLHKHETAEEMRACLRKQGYAAE